MSINASFDTDETTHGRLIAASEPLPGQWIPGDYGSSRTWSGEIHWRTKAGEATICWIFAEPRQVFNARLPNGKILPFIENASEVDKSDWRRPMGGIFLHVQIEISEHGVIFRNGSQPFFEPLALPGPDEDPNLEADLGHDTAFLDLIQDIGVAHAAYDWLRNRDFRKTGYAGRWFACFPHIAGFIAEMRQNGETYTDFYPLGGDFTPENLDSFKTILKRLGWAELTMVERIAIYSEQFRRRIPHLAKPPLKTSMQKAAIADQVTQAEWSQLIELLN